MEMLRMRTRILIVSLWSLLFLLLGTGSVQAQDTATYKLKLIGNGALGITAGEDVSSGAFGLDFQHRDLTRFTALITIESSAGGLESTQQSTFAESLLPIRNTDNGLYLMFQRSKILWGGGIQAYLNTGSATWSLRSEDESETTVRTEDLTLTAAGFDVIWDPFHDFTIQNNSVRFLLGGGVTVRAISGNLAQNDGLRTDLLGTDETFFWGPEGVAVLQINDVDVTLSIPYLFASNGDKVRGLTGGRLHGNINIQAGLDLGLRKRDKQEERPSVATLPAPSPPNSPAAMQ